MARRASPQGRIGPALLGAALATLVAAGGGCEVAIGSAVPDFECLSNSTPAVCPGSEVCDQRTHQCVVPCSATGCMGGQVCDPSSDTCVAASGDDDGSSPETSPGDDGDADATTAPDEAAPPAETGPTETTPPCNTVGCACSGASSCASGICADSSLAPSQVLTESGTNFCTKPCCTSADCDPGTICFATGGSNSVAANFCVDPAWLTRGTVVGTQPGGGSCSTGRDCRSGLCSGSTCADTCCSTAGTGEPNQCASGTSCRFDAFPGAVSFDKNFVAWCGTSGNGQNGATCNQNSSCQSNLCDSIDGCSNACRNTADCSQGESCAYVTPPPPDDTAVVAACFGGAGNASEGSSCSSDNDCKSQFCDTGGTDECSDVCFSNADCTKSGWRCRPERITLTSGGEVTVLACGP